MFNISNITIGLEQFLGVCVVILTWKQSFPRRHVPISNNHFYRTQTSSPGARRGVATPNYATFPSLSPVNRAERSELVSERAHLVMRIKQTARVSLLWRTIFKLKAKRRGRNLHLLALPFRTDNFPLWRRRPRMRMCRRLFVCMYACVMFSDCLRYGRNNKYPKS